MLLAIDVGNTLTDFGFFLDGELRERFSIKTESNRSQDEIQASFSLLLKDKGIEVSCIEGAIISSVVPPLTPIYQGIVLDLFGVEAKVLGPKLKTGIRVDVEEPKEVGADLIADCAGALKKYGPSCIIADLGTATKVLLLTDKGAFAGCTIGAGMAISLDAMVSKTAVLPEISLQIPNKIVGRNTVDCMNSALTYGTAFGIKGLCDAIEKEVGYPLKRILTGGYAKYVAPLLGEFDYAPNLCLEGLAAIHSKNGK